MSLLSAAELPAHDDTIARIAKLFEQERWDQLAAEAQVISPRGPELEFYHGVTLARLGRWDEAHARLLAGQRLRRNDERFLIELGGIAFKQRRYREAAKRLRQAIRLNHSDSYAADFLGTIYFLQGNLEAALKYWNRIGKPQIERVLVEPRLRVDPALLDRALVFAPGDRLLLSELLTSRARTDALGILSTQTFGLTGRVDGTFDLEFAALERNGWGNSKWEALLSTFRGAVHWTIHPEYFNLARGAINVTSVVRLDAQKRRLQASLSSPVRRDPKYRYWFGLDARNELWELRRSFDAPAPALGALRLHRNAVGGGISSFRNGRWSWSSGGELSYRDYEPIAEGSALRPDVLLTGYQVKHTAHVSRELWRLPERRFEGGVHVSSEAGRIWSAASHRFERLQISGSARWLPQMTGDDYAVQQHVRAGKSFGQVAFDELFVLGLERDNDLWMRAHIGTRDGRKGSAPMGHTYFLSNAEIDKNLYDDGLLRVKVSPFLDVGKIGDRSLMLGSGAWLWDTGVQAKLRILGVGFTFVYGRDLRSGNNAVYVMAGR